MPLRQETFKEVTNLVASGKTEKALVTMRQSLEKDAPDQRHAMRQILLLSGQYFKWEDEQLSGVKDDSKELARINKELLRLVDNLANPDDQTQPFSDPTTTSPDPLRPVYIQMQAPSHPQQPAKEKNNVMKYITYFLIGMGLLAVLSLIIDAVDGPDPVPEQETSSLSVTPATEGNTTTSTTVAPATTPAATGNAQNPPSRSQPAVPANTSPTPPPPSALENLPTPPPEPAFQPQVSQLLTDDIRNAMLALAASGEELQPSDLLQLEYSELSRQFGNTSWYHPDLGTIAFSPNGQTATYLNGYAALQIVYSTTYGFYIGTYAESTTGDTGYMSLVPPNNTDVVTVYVESEGSGLERAIDWERL